MGGVHEDEIGSQYLRPVYRLGDIIRSTEYWGIVLRASGNQYNSRPYDVLWWRSPTWLHETYATPPSDITFPISVHDQSIPDAVLAKSAEIKLRGHP